MRKIIIYLYLLTMIYALFEKVEEYLHLSPRQEHEQRSSFIKQQDNSEKDSLLCVPHNKLQQDSIISDNKKHPSSSDNTHRNLLIEPSNADVVW